MPDLGNGQERTFPEPAIPVSVGVLADLSGHTRHRRPLRERRFARVTTDNVNALLEAAQPRLEFWVPNCLMDAPGHSLKVSLQFRSLGDFEPDSFGFQIVPVRQLLRVRRALENLLAIFTPKLADVLRQIEEEYTSQRMIASLDRFGDALSRACHFESAEEKTFAAECVETWLDCKYNLGQDGDLGNMFSGYDELIRRQSDAVMQHPDFRRLRHTWTSLYRLAEAVEESADLRLRVLDVTPAELLDDLRRASHAENSNLHALVAGRELGSFGGQPFNIVLLDHPLTRQQSDMELLDRLAHVFTQSLSVLVTAVAPRFFGVESLEELAAFSDLRRLMRAGWYGRFDSFRQSLPAQHVVLFADEHGAWDGAARLALHLAGLTDLSPLRSEALQQLEDAMRAEGFGTASGCCDQLRTICAPPRGSRALDVLRLFRTAHLLSALFRLKAEAFASAREWEEFIRHASSLKDCGITVTVNDASSIGSLHLEMASRQPPDAGEGLRWTLDLRSWRIMAYQATAASRRVAV